MGKKIRRDHNTAHKKLLACFQEGGNEDVKVRMDGFSMLWRSDPCILVMVRCGVKDERGVSNCNQIFRLNN